MRVRVRLRRRRLACPRCSFTTRHRYDTREVDSSWRHLDMGGSAGSRCDADGCAAPSTGCWPRVCGKPGKDTATLNALFDAVGAGAAEGIEAVSMDMGPPTPQPCASAHPVR